MKPKPKVGNFYFLDDRVCKFQNEKSLTGIICTGYSWYFDGYGSKLKPLNISHLLGEPVDEYLDTSYYSSMEIFRHKAFYREAIISLLKVDQLDIS